MQIQHTRAFRKRGHFHATQVESPENTPQEPQDGITLGRAIGSLAVGAATGLTGALPFFGIAPTAMAIATNHDIGNTRGMILGAAGVGLNAAALVLPGGTESLWMLVASGALGGASWADLLISGKAL